MRTAAAALMATRHSPLEDDAVQLMMLLSSMEQFCQRSAACPLPFTSHCCKERQPSEQSPGKRLRHPPTHSPHPQGLATQQPQWVPARLCLAGRLQAHVLI